MVFCPDRFLSEANAAFILSDQQRYGQFLMNFLYQKHPEVVVPEKADCFYDNSKVKEFLQFIYTLSC